VLFEDYLPIRLAGRRIYGYLGKVIDEVRLERQGEITRAREICNNLNLNIDSCERDVIEYAHDVWDILIDESLLLEQSLNSDDTANQPQEVGVLTMSQLLHLRVDKVLAEMNLIHVEDFETIFTSAVRKEEAYMGRLNKKSENMEMTFVSFASMLFQCSEPETCEKYWTAMLRQLEHQAIYQRHESQHGSDASTLLATKAIHSGSNNTCKKRQQHSDQFDEYMSKFKVWEDRFVGNKNSDHPSRRLGKCVHRYLLC
jgi:hypothetical protein